MNELSLLVNAARIDPVLRDAAVAVERRFWAQRDALKAIYDTAQWYANNGQRLAHEVDHALCVEILDEAQRALEDGC
jgi:hypothetical protein